MRAETLLASDFSADAALAALTAPRTVGAAQGAAQVSSAGTLGAPTLGVPGAPGGARTADADAADAAPRVAAIAPEAVAVLLGMPAGLQRYP